MNTKTLLLALALVLALAISTCEARNYYVAPSGGRQGTKSRGRGSKQFKNPFLKRFIEQYYGNEPYVGPDEANLYADEAEME